MLAFILVSAGVLDLVSAVRGWRPAPLLLPMKSVIIMASAVLVLYVVLLQLLVAAAAGDAVGAARLRRRSRRLHGTDRSGLHGGASRSWRFPALLSTGLLLVGAAWLLIAGAWVGSCCSAGSNSPPTGSS